MSHDYRNIFFFFFNDTATTEIYTLSLHDALPIRARPAPLHSQKLSALRRRYNRAWVAGHESAELCAPRSEEHTSELQSRQYLVCRLLLEKKKINTHTYKLLIMIHIYRTLSSLPTF